jgi:pimeloyl-ACP methyl ester carboxylesterase
MRVLAPTHPGWNGTERPERLADVPALAGFYLDQLATAGHRDVLLVGSSLGGWIAAEMAVRDDTGLIGALVIIDGVGITVDRHPIRDFFALDPRGVAEFSYHDPERFYVDPATLTDEQRTQRIGNVASLRALAGDPYMHDPTLAARLAAIDVPTLVLWGESDRIVTSGYGRALAERIPGASFELILRAGHLPQLERPEATFDSIDAFLAGADFDRARVSH